MTKKNETRSKALPRAVFFVYCLVMLWLLFGQRLHGWNPGEAYLSRLEGSVNLNPLETIRLFWRVTESSSDGYMVRQAFINLAGNIVMFIPFGFLLPCIWKRMHSFFKSILCAAAVILIVELLQLLSLLGSFDVDDLLLNLIGVSLGWLFWRLINK